MPVTVQVAVIEFSHTPIRAFRSDGGEAYTVVYTDDLHTKEISLTDTFGVNPPPQGPNGVSAFRQFWGVRATYFVYDGTVPTTKRYLIWDEPGTWPKSTVGLPVYQFFLLTAA